MGATSKSKLKKKLIYLNWELKKLLTERNKLSPSMFSPDRNRLAEISKAEARIIKKSVRLVVKKSVVDNWRSQWIELSIKHDEAMGDRKSVV